MTTLRHSPVRARGDQARGAMQSILGLTAATCMSGALGLAAAPAATARVSCEHWNTEEFFAEADAAAVSDNWSFPPRTKIPVLTCVLSE